MRRTIFGGYVVESKDDDAFEALIDAGEVYAIVRPEEGKFDFEVLDNEDGEVLLSSEPIFDTYFDAMNWLNGLGVDDVQEG